MTEEELLRRYWTEPRFHAAVRLLWDAGVPSADAPRLVAGIEEILLADDPNP